MRRKTDRLSEENRAASVDVDAGRYLSACAVLILVLVSMPWR
jgi:hypothetical protein